MHFQCHVSVNCDLRINGLSLRILLSRVKYQLSTLYRIMGLYDMHCGTKLQSFANPSPFACVCKWFHAISCPFNKVSWEIPNSRAGIPRRNFPGGSFPQGTFPGGNFPGISRVIPGNFPRFGNFPWFGNFLGEKISRPHGREGSGISH